MSEDEVAKEVEAINRTIQETLEKSDRIRAVLLGAQIDRLLELLLEAYLVPKKGRSDRLLGGSGFAGTFSARVELAYRVGLIRPDWYHDLKIMNKIRDAFAHGLAGLSMRDDSLFGLCRSLKSGAEWIEGNSRSGIDVDNPQTRFVGGSLVLCLNLCLARANLKRIPAVWEKYSHSVVQGSD